MLSLEDDIAMFMELRECPTTRLVMPARWFESVRRGSREELFDRSVVEGELKESNNGRDQTCIDCESEEPERIKLDVGSTARLVTGERCDCEVETWRPVHICSII